MSSGRRPNGRDEVCDKQGERQSHSRHNPQMRILRLTARSDPERPGETSMQTTASVLLDSGLSSWNIGLLCSEI